MRPSRKLYRCAVAAFGAAVLIAIAIAAIDAAAAETAPPEIIKSHFACSGGVCTIGPGNVGTRFGAGLVGTGGPPQSLESNSYKMSIVSGSLPPGLKLSLPDAEWMIGGTPTKAGTYSFTVQIADIAGGPNGRQQFTIPIGTGKSDNLQISAADYREKTEALVVSGFDVNLGVTYTVYSTSTGAQLGKMQELNSGNGEQFAGNGGLTFYLYKPLPIPPEITVTDSFGSSVTVPVGRIAPY